MNGERKSYTERILNAIEYGRLSTAETERRLCALIEDEVNKTDSAADMELIEACQSLLWQLHTHGAVAYDSHREKNSAAIAKRLRRHMSQIQAIKSAGKVLATAAAIVLVVLGLSGRLHWSWLEHDNTFDQQQHIIAGNEAGIDLVRSAIADHLNEEIAHIITVEELRAEFSFIPVPEQIHETWYYDSATAFVSPDMIRLDIHYNNINGKQTFLYTAVVFTSAEDTFFAFEQSNMGSAMEVLGNHVYVTQNVAKPVFNWTQGLAIVRAAGDIDENEGLSIIEFLIGEWLK